MLLAEQYLVGKIAAIWDHNCTEHAKAKFTKVAMMGVTQLLCEPDQALH
jgi:hypothetical protein